MKIKTLKINFKKLCSKAEKVKGYSALWSQGKFGVLRDLIVSNIKDPKKITAIYTSPDIMTVLQTVKLGNNQFVTKVEGNMYEYVFHFADFELTGFVDIAAVKEDGTNDNFVMFRFNDGTSKVLNFNADDFVTDLEEKAKKTLWQKIKSIFTK